MSITVQCIFTSKIASGWLRGIRHAGSQDFGAFLAAIRIGFHIGPDRNGKRGGSCIEANAGQHPLPTRLPEGNAAYQENNCEQENHRQKAGGIQEAPGVQVTHLTALPSLAHIADGGILLIGDPAVLLVSGVIGHGEKRAQKAARKARLSKGKTADHFAFQGGKIVLFGQC